MERQERPTTFAEWIRTERERRGWSQTEIGLRLTDLLGRPFAKAFTGQQIGRWERGEHDPQDGAIYEGFMRLFGWPLPYGTADGHTPEPASATRVLLKAAA